MRQKLHLWLLFLLVFSAGQEAYTQCTASVDNIFFYCRPENPGYYLVFRVTGNANTFSIVDLNGNIANNTGFFADDITDGETATTNPIVLTGVNDAEYRYFGPFTDGTTIDAVLVDIGMMVCDTIPIFEGSFTCDEQSDVCGPNLPFYNMDFSLSQIDSFLIIERARGEGCSDNNCVPGNGKRCFEFRVILDEDVVGLEISDSGSGSPAGELYAANELSPMLCQDLFDSNPAGDNETSICLAESNTYILMSCKQGGNTTSAVVSAIRRPSAPAVATAEPCNIELSVENASIVSWSSPDDPNLLNFNGCDMDSLNCFFLYNEAVFGPVTECAGDTFMYIVSAAPEDTTCIGDIMLLDTGLVVVYPIFNVQIDSFCDPLTPDSLTLTATVTSPAMGCEYAYAWSTGDTTETIRVSAEGGLFSVTVVRGDLPSEVQSCVGAIDSIEAFPILQVDCSMLGDSMYQCIDEIPDPDTSLVIFTGCGEGGIIYANQTSNGGAGCTMDPLIITRYYIIDFDGDTINTTDDRDSCIQVFTVIDDTAPALIQDSCPPDTVIDCSVTDLSGLGMPMFTDNCTISDDIIVSFRDDTLAGFGICSNDTLGLIMRTWFAADDCGNVDSSCGQFIAIIDTIPPDLTACASLDLTIACDSDMDNATNAALWNTNNIAALEVCAVDACDDMLTGQVTSDFDFGSLSSTCGSAGTLVVTYTVEDDCGNASTMTATLTINDNADPVITCPADMTIECNTPTDPATTGMATATDNCDPSPMVTFNDVSTPGACANESIITRTWTATDDCGNTATCTQIITVDDSTDPIFTCPADMTVECDESTDVDDTGMATATDNCDSAPIVDFTDETTPGACANAMVITRTWTATDACGNTATCTQIITVNDTTAPAITCPGDVTVECNTSTAPDSTGMATATDNCDSAPIVNFTDETTPGACASEMVITRTWTATDACGNTATCTQIITVDDSTDPVITCPADMTIECTDSTDPMNTGTATATDNCDIDPEVTFVDSGVAGDCATGGILRTWTAVDACGNSATCTQRIFIDDSVDPVITCPADMTVECNTPTDPATTGMATATDNCDPSPMVTFNDVTTPGACANESIITRTWTATDDCGNTATCTQIITVDDSTDPIITCPADMTVECDGSTDVDDTGMATATDNCDSAPIVDFTDETTPGACANEMVITRTWTATDACGNTATCTQIITVDDTTAPVITCPGDVTVECNTSTAPDSTGMATATDNCDSAPIVNFTDETTPGACANEMVITRTWTATDACGNTATCTQIITVDDSTDPVITCPADMTIECTDSTDPMNTGTATATDNCDMDPEVTFVDSGVAGDCATGGILRTWTAVDACGNSATCTQRIFIDDSVDPVITCPADMTIECNTPLDPATTGMATATDNCDPSPMVTFNDVTTPGACANESIITRTWTATDDCGNTATCTQIITVDDSTDPIITCPADMTVECDGSTDVDDTGMATATDNCDSAPIVDFTDETTPGACANAMVITRIWTATDACGNTATCTQIITVDDTTAPVITCPGDVTVECNTSTAPDSTGMATATDNCDSAPIVNFTDETTPGACASEMVITRTWTATDACGNSSTCTQIITVDDSTDPVITCPADMTIECTDSTDPMNTGTATATDNCTTMPMVSSTDEVTPGACAYESVIVRTWTAIDDCGNSATCTQVITIVDSTPPTFTAPTDATIDCSEDFEDLTITGDISGLSDNCSSNAEIDTAFLDDLSELAGCNGTGFITRTFILTDACGNSASETQVITIENMTPPVIVFPDSITVDCDVDYTDLMITGDIDFMDGGCGDLTLDTVIVSDELSLDGCNETGTVLRTFTVTDLCGNMTTGTQVITVQDTTPPMAICMDITLDFMGDSVATIVPEDVDNGSFDACGPVSLSLDIDSFSCADFDGQATVILTVTDECGLSSTCSAEVTFVNSSQIEVTCPDTIFIVPGNGDCDVILEYDFNFFDVCGAGFTIEQIDVSGFMLGDTVPLDTCFEQMYIAYNEFGDTARCNFFVKVADQPAQETFACKSEINVSLDQNCQIVITPGLLLVGGQYGCIDNYLISPKDDTVTLINGNIIDESFVGQSIAIMVTNLITGNRCWTLINVEDKLGPSLECRTDSIFCYEDRSPEAFGFPLPDTVTLIPLGDNTYEVEGFGNCGASTLQYFDEINYMPCTGPYTEQIVRHWTAFDNNGNQASCNDTIWVLRVGLEEVTLPPHFDGTEEQPLECGDDLCLLADGTPNVLCTGTPGGNLCSNIFYDFKDFRTNKCGSSYTINRTWRIINFCNGDKIQYIQRIKVLDTTSPEIECLDTLTVSTGPWTCEANVELPLPQVFDACSGTEIKVFSPLGPVPEVGGKFVLQGIGIGHHLITYQVNDDCYNQASCTMILEVVDQTLPVVVCDQHTTVTITEYETFGLSLVNAVDLAEDSYDECGPVTVYGRRMDSCIDFDWTTNGAGEDRIPNGQVNGLDMGTSEFREKIPFACCDAGNGSVMVEILVVDQFGNSNTCMVEVTVQDKLLPTITCPPDISFACQMPFLEEAIFDIDDKTFGTVLDGNIFDDADREPVVFAGQNWGIDGIARQACGVDIRMQVNDFRDDCGVGQIHRVFTAESAGGSRSCTQVITIFNSDPFYINPENDEDPNDDVIWPNDTTIVGSCNTEPVDSGQPVLLGDFCSLTAPSFKDVIYGELEGACSKVLRTWKVIDWCQYDGVGGGEWEYLQIIKVINTEGPAVTSCEDLVLCQDNPEFTESVNQPCTADLVLTQQVADDCTPAEDIEWWFRIDLNDDGSFEIASNTYTGAMGGASIDLDGNLNVIAVIQGLEFNDPNDPNDQHRIEWNFRDHCSQETSCSQAFRLEDCKAPSAVCQDISGNFMPTGDLEIWASDFNASSNDNCTDQADLVYSFSGDFIQPSMTLDCDDVEQAQSDVLPINMWVWDEWGNVDLCIASFTVDNAAAICGPDIAPIAGFIETEVQEGIANVLVDLENDSGNENFSTSGDGHYQFDALDMNEQYTIKPVRNDNHKNGVTTLDLIRIQQHILGIAPLESPYKRIAADANNTQTITASDILELRKLILGIYDELPANQSWRFVDQAYNFPDPYSPWPFPEEITIDPLMGPAMESDFVGVKIGDVNGTVTANAQILEVRNNQTSDLLIRDELLHPGEVYRIPVKIGKAGRITGLQLEFGTPNARIEDILAGELEIRGEHQLKTGEWTRISWNHHIPAEVDVEAVLFELVISVDKALWLHEILQVSDEWFDPAVYFSNSLTETEEATLQLRFTDEGKETVFALYQNDPNPWSEHTEISFVLPESMPVSFVVYDQFGKQILERKLNAFAGLNSLRLNKSEIPSSGILYFRLQAEGFVATKKMIFFK